MRGRFGGDIIIDYLASRAALLGAALMLMCALGGWMVQMGDGAEDCLAETSVSEMARTIDLASDVDGRVVVDVPEGLPEGWVFEVRPGYVWLDVGDRMVCGTYDAEVDMDSPIVLRPGMSMTLETTDAGTLIAAAS